MPGLDEIRRRMLLDPTGMTMGPAPDMPAALPPAPFDPSNMPMAMPGGGMPADAAAPPAINPTMQQPEPKKPGAFKSMLMDFTSTFREALQREMGVMTDSERQQQQFQRQMAVTSEQRRLAQEQAEAASRQALNEDVQIPDGQGGVITVPRRSAGQVTAAILRKQSSMYSADAGLKKTEITADAATTRANADRASREKIAKERNDVYRAVSGDKTKTQLAVAAMRQAKKSGGTGDDLDAYVEAAAMGLPLNQMPAKVRASVAVLARQRGVNVAFKPMGPAAQRAIDGITEVLPSLDDYVDELEQSGAAGKNSLMDKAKALGQGAAYTAGFKTENAANLQLGNLIGILAAQPYTSVGRGKYLFDEVQKHVPGMNNTPAAKLDKARNLQRLLPQLMEHIAKNQAIRPQGTGAMAPTPTAPNQPPAANGWGSIFGDSKRVK